MTDFYDLLAPWYHLVYQDWDGSIERQTQQLVRLIQRRWGQENVKSILDVSCGIGTQSLGLAKQGFRMTASDVSTKAIARAREEAARRGLDMSLSVCDMRGAYQHHRRQFDLVISCDNSIPHLLSDQDILQALRQMYQCVRTGGGSIISVRDYDNEERGTGIVKPYGTRQDGEKRIIIFQVWDFVGEFYDLSMYFIVDANDSDAPETHVMRSRCYAVSAVRLLCLMQEAGFKSVERLDGVFFQPVLVGTKQD